MFIVENQKFEKFEEAFDFALVFSIGAEVLLGCPIGILIYEENTNGKYGPSWKEANILIVFSTHVTCGLFWEKYVENI